MKPIKERHGSIQQQEQYLEVSILVLRLINSSNCKTVLFLPSRRPDIHHHASQSQAKKRQSQRPSKQDAHAHAYCWVVRISESPASVMDKTEQRKSLPQAVPRSMLSIVAQNQENLRYGAHVKIEVISSRIHTAVIVVDTGLGQHSVILDFGLAQRGAVASDDDQLGYFFFYVVQMFKVHREERKDGYEGTIFTHSWGSFPL